MLWYWFYIPIISFLSAPTAPPQNVRNTSTSSATITVEWGRVECIERNTEITGYRVRYDPPSSDGTGEVSASGDGCNGGSIILTGLSPFTSYSIEVAADSDHGRGPFSSAITVMTDGEFTLDILFHLVRAHKSLIVYTCIILNKV